MTLSYQIQGDGSPLLLIHGMGVTYTIWANLAPLLRPHYKLIMVEMPGHGASPALSYQENYYQSSAEQLERLRQELGIEQWTILGYSMGAWAAQAYIQRYEEHVSGAIFLCPGVVTTLWSHSLKSLVRIDQVFPSLSEWLLHDWRLRLLVRLLGFNGHAHPYARLWSKEIASQPVGVIKALLRDLPGAGRADFPIPGCPTMIIWGSKDTVTARPRHLRTVDRLVEGTHSAPMLAAQDVAFYIRNFEVPQIVHETTVEPDPNWETGYLSIEGAS